MPRAVASSCRSTHGSVTVAADASVGTYDGADDTLVSRVALFDDGGGGSVTGLSITGTTSYVTTSAGADFALTPITFNYTKNGVPGQVIAHLRLIYTGGQWRYLTMQPDSTPANHDDNTPDPDVP